MNIIEQYNNFALQVIQNIGSLILCFYYVNQITLTQLLILDLSLRIITLYIYNYFCDKTVNMYEINNTVKDSITIISYCQLEWITKTNYIVLTSLNTIILLTFTVIIISALFKRIEIIIINISNNEEFKKYKLEIISFILMTCLLNGKYVRLILALNIFWNLLITRRIQKYELLLSEIEEDVSSIGSDEGSNSDADSQLDEGADSQSEKDDIPEEEYVITDQNTEDFSKTTH
jgi:hypothetical protein